MGRNVDFHAIKLPADLGAMDDNSRRFLRRVYNGGLERYVRRIKSLGIEGMERVLDAGAGFGQWSLAWAGVTRWVYAAEIEAVRLQTARQIAHENDVHNILYILCSIENLPFPADSLDAVFCYSVIYSTNYQRTIAEFHRVLRPEGLLYFSTNGLGWYLYNIIKNHNPAADFNPRQYGFRTLLNSFRFLCGVRPGPGQSLAMSPGGTRRLLEKTGFGEINVAGDGQIGLGRQGQRLGFYPGRFMGLPNVFEILAKKGRSAAR